MWTFICARVLTLLNEPIALLILDALLLDALLLDGLLLDPLLPILVVGGSLTPLVDLRVLRTVNIRTTDIYLDDPVERPGFEIEATIDPGDSGALVVLPGGGVGVIWARSNEREQRAWAVDLPSELVDPGVRAEFSDPSTTLADVGGCIRSGG